MMVSGFAGADVDLARLVEDGLALLIQGGRAGWLEKFQRSSNAIPRTTVQKALLCLIGISVINKDPQVYIL